MTGRPRPRRNTRPKRARSTHTPTGSQVPPPTAARPPKGAVAVGQSRLTPSPANETVHVA
jgi:hypothetical protein